jgi:hypothetical protein
MLYTTKGVTCIMVIKSFAALSKVVALSQGELCSYLSSSCKYALFSFLKRDRKNQSGKKLTIKLQKCYNVTILLSKLICLVLFAFQFRVAFIV